MVKKAEFGNLNGQKVYKYIITNGNLSAEVLSYGGIVNRLIYKGKDLVLGYDTLNEYIEHKGNFFGATVGRCANRIKGGKFTLNGKEYNLTLNEKGINCLHGGDNNFARKIYSVKEEENAVILSAKSCDMEDGFPANLKVDVKFSVENDSLIIEYFGESDSDTVCNFTNHSYFNINGAPESVLNDKLTVNADKITPVDENLCPYNEYADVLGSPFDFRKGKRIGDIIPEKLKFLDNNFVLNGNGYRKVASVVGAKSNIQMDVYTTEAGMQIYLAGFGKPHKGKDGVEYSGNCFYCFEAQNHPNAINCNVYPSPVLKKGEKYYQKTSYKFIDLIYSKK